MGTGPGARAAIRAAEKAGMKRVPQVGRPCSSLPASACTARSLFPVTLLQPLNGYDDLPPSCPLSFSNSLLYAHHVNESHQPKHNHNSGGCSEQQEQRADATPGGHSRGPPQPRPDSPQNPTPNTKHTVSAVLNNSPLA